MRLSFAGLFRACLSRLRCRSPDHKPKKKKRVTRTQHLFRSVRKQLFDLQRTSCTRPAQQHLRRSKSSSRPAASAETDEPPKSFKSPRPFRALRQNESRFIRRDSNTTKGDVSGLTLHIRHSDRMTRTLCAFFPLVIGFEQKKFLSKRKSSAFKPFLLFLFFNKNTNLEIAF